MSDAAVVSALIAKRKDLQDRAAELAEELDRLQQTIFHLEGAIVAIDPNMDRVLHERCCPTCGDAILASVVLGWPSDDRAYPPDR